MQWITPEANARPVAASIKASGLALGLGLVFVLNQARILALFYAYRNERSLFDLLHTTVLPAVLIAAVALYFYAVLHRSHTRLA